jgi:acyl-CoA dehydrogenase
LTAGVFVPKNEEDAVGALEAALHAVIAAETVEAKMRAAVKAGTLAGAADVLAAKALAAGIITAEDAKVLERAHMLRRRVIMVDDFPLDLGKSEMFQTTQAVTFEALHRA